MAEAHHILRKIHTLNDITHPTLVFEIA